MIAKDTQPYISIIIPVYEGRKYFRELLQDIQKQSLQNIEIILVDDCGTDGAFEEALLIAQQDSRFVCLRNETNVGQGICHDAVYNYIQVPTSSTHVGKTRKHFQILQFYKSVEQHILKLDTTDKQKRQWLQIVNGRKKKDYTAFYNDMLPEFKEEFKAIADEHVSTQYL